ncbi:MAG: signal recognition particle-docking protein FtsY [Eubacteriales bacterium]
MGFFEKLKQGLAKTREGLTKQFDNLFSRFKKVDEDFLEELEELLITGDMGVGVTQEVIEKLRVSIKEKRIHEPSQVREELQNILTKQLGDTRPLAISTKPAVILVIGVNGVGKTTSIAKLSALLKSEGKRVVLAAADTFRAAAIDQLAVWARRAGVDIIKQSEGSDPAAVVYDAIAACRSRGADVLIIDTAGRLHNKKNLMDELAKINRVIERELSGASRETLLILDSTTGQNAVMQAKEFKQAAGITGLILTKLDGTAKGGAVFSVKKELDIPILFVCTGEKIDDIQPFVPQDFVKALFD